MCVCVCVCVCTTREREEVKRLRDLAKVLSPEGDAHDGLRYTSQRSPVTTESALRKRPLTLSKRPSDPCVPQRDGNVV